MGDMRAQRAAPTQSPPRPRTSVRAFVFLAVAVAGHLPGASAVLTAPVDAASRLAADGTTLAALRRATAAQEKMHFWDGRCNPLRYRDWDYLTRDTTDLGDVQWDADDGFTLHNGSRAAADTDVLWVRSSVFVAARYGAAWLRGGTAAGRSDVWVTYKRSLGELFLTHTELQKRYGESWYSFSQFRHWSFYKRTFEETTFPIVRDVRRPADLVSDEGRLAYTYGNEDAATSAFLRRGVQVVDLSSKTLVHLQLPGVAAPGVHYALTPTLAGDWCAMTLWDDASKTPTVVLYDFAKKSWHRPVRQADAIGFNAFAWNATGTQVAEGLETQAYLLAWELELQRYPTSPLLLRRLEPAPSDTHTYGLSLPLPDTKHVTLRIVGLPSRASCLVPPSFWAVQGYNFTEPVYSAAAGGFVDVGAEADFTVLRGALGAGHRVFLVLSSEGGGVEYFVVVVVLVGMCDGGAASGVAGLAACRKTVMVDTVSREPIYLKSAHSSGVVFTVGSGPAATTWIAKVYEAADGSEAFGTCRAFDESDTAVGEVSVVADMMLYQRGPAADATAFRIMQADLDKDNDGSWDMVDRFPLAPDYQNDKDNDGIGDKQDLVDMRGRCRDHLRTNVGECASDLVVMYSAWGVFTFLLITLAASVGSYRKYFLDDLYSKRRAATREWIDRQWRETARQDIAEEELFQIMAEIDDKIQAQEGFRGELVVQAILFLLTIMSVGLWIASLWSSGTSLKFDSTLAWIDLYTTTVFFVDLLYRWIFRHEGEYKHFRDYCVKNWYDFPSLITDIPGLTNAGPLALLVVARLIRALRIFKMFRVVRLYHRVTQQQAILGLILRYDTAWLSIFMCFMILSFGVIIKLFEQDEQDVFEPYENVLWFCIVTVTTIGYGDMVPVNPVARILAVILMVSGIGIIGVLTASMGESVRESGIDKTMLKEKVKKTQHGKWRLSTEVLRHSVLFNPLLARFKPYERGRCAHPQCLKMSRVLDRGEAASVVKLTYENFRYHSECFRCTACGQEPTGEEGVCWVVPDTSSISRFGTLRHLFTGRNNVSSTNEEYANVCRAAIFLHKACFNKARGGGRVKTDSATSVLSTSMNSTAASYDDSFTKTTNTIKQETLRSSSPALGRMSSFVSAASETGRLCSVEEIHVKGLFGIAERFNGTYTRRMSMQTRAVVFDHDATNLATIVRSEQRWKLLFKVSRDLDTCAAQSSFLIGTWETPRKMQKLYGCPVVEDLGAQLHFWHAMYDPLDMPVRSLVVNYASTRTRKQFAQLLECMESEMLGTAMVGKFSAGANMPDRATLSEHTHMMERLGRQIKAAVSLEGRRTRLRKPCHPSAKLSLVLQTHRLHECDKIKAYPLLCAHLEYLIFKKPRRPCGTSMERAFALLAVAEAANPTNRYKLDASNLQAFRQWDDADLDWTDTVEWTLHEVDRCLLDHGVDQLPQFTGVRVELEHLVLAYDRVLACSWAFDHLSWSNWHETAARPVKQKELLAEMPAPPPDRAQYAEYEVALMDPMADKLEQHQAERGRDLAQARVSSFNLGRGGRETPVSKQRRAAMDYTS